MKRMRDAKSEWASGSDGGERNGAWRVLRCEHLRGLETRDGGLLLIVFRSRSSGSSSCRVHRLRGRAFQIELLRRAATLAAFSGCLGGGLLRRQRYIVVLLLRSGAFGFAHERREFVRISFDLYTARISVVHRSGCGRLLGGNGLGVCSCACLPFNSSGIRGDC